MENKVPQEQYDDLVRRTAELEAEYERLVPLLEEMHRHLLSRKSKQKPPQPENPLQGSLFPPEAR